jgi:hypothetical protein
MSIVVQITRGPTSQTRLPSSEGPSYSVIVV